MPSEQLHGHPKLCSDVYALGLTAIQALTGVPPQQLPKDPNTLEIIWRDRVQVSDWLANILTKMVRYHFSNRYQSATEALQALNQAPPSRPALIDTKWGYIDQTGQVFIQPTFNTMHAITNRFFEWLQPAKLGKKWGYVNQAKKVVIPPQFDYAWDFSEGLAVVKIGKKQGYIDQTGEIVIPPEFDKAKPFSGGRAQIKMGEQHRYIDKTGKFIDPE
jgi:serine/threonine-protein kinase